jgi:predicted nucleic acid-binding Zn ribbon protein
LGEAWPAGSSPAGWSAASTGPGPRLARAALDAARAAGRTFTTKPRPAEDGQSLRRRRWSAAGPDPRDPQPIGGLVRRLVADRGWEKPAAEARVLGDWPALVGPEIAARCRPVGLRDGELTLAAESTAWATQLRLLTNKLLATLATQLGPDVVKRIRVHGPAVPSWKKGRLSVRGRGPRDTYG